MGVFKWAIRASIEKMLQVKNCEARNGQSNTPSATYLVSRSLVFTIYGHGGHVVHMTSTVKQLFVTLTPRGYMYI